MYLTRCLVHKLCLQNAAKCKNTQFGYSSLSCPSQNTYMHTYMQSLVPTPHTCICNNSYSITQSNAKWLHCSILSSVSWGGQCFQTRPHTSMVKIWLHLIRQDHGLRTFLWSCITCTDMDMKHFDMLKIMEIHYTVNKHQWDKGWVSNEKGILQAISSIRLRLTRYSSLSSAEATS